MGVGVGFGSSLGSDGSEPGEGVLAGGWWVVVGSPGVVVEGGGSEHSGGVSVDS